nr:beta-N-acetylhexosaminidase [uncultured Bacillus sp.]
MWKRLLLFGVVLAVAFFAIRFVMHDDAPENRDPLPGKPADDAQPLEPEEQVKEIFALAKEGKAFHIPFIVGKTKMDEVEDAWGDPEKVENHSGGSYADFPDRDVSIGYQDALVFELRSYHSELKKIHFEDIQKVAGEPDDITYYQDEKYDQIILIYKAAENLQLKWVLPRPADAEPNPAVHHVNVVAKINPSNINGIKDKLSAMTLDEKIGQMIFAGISGTTMTEETNRLINSDQVGGIIFYKNNISSVQQVIALQNELRAANTGNRLPLFFGADQEGGQISRLPDSVQNLPSALTIGNKNNPKFANEIGRILGKELKNFGFNLDFAPVLDVNSNPNNPVIGNRSFGSNPDIVSTFGIEMMKGIQSEKVIPVVKHFPGHGDTSADSHLELPTVNKSLGELEQLEMIPFKEAVENGADVVMVAHILFPQIDPVYPSSMSKKIITDMLRGQLGFNGVVITDDITMGAIVNQYSIAQAAVQSVKAGSDIILVAHGNSYIQSVIQAIKSAVENGEITEDRIDDSAARIIHLKQSYSLENTRVQNVNIEQLNQQISAVLNQYQ